jgi:uncharacterized UBP type Zn finger protein
MSETCPHFESVPDFGDQAIAGCEECLKSGDKWVHLRRCLVCGKVGCCNDSKNKHATAHFNEVGHTPMQTAEPNEDWIWCFTCEVGYEPPRGA